MDNLIGNEIGRGGFGIVYQKKDDPSKCIKISDKSGGSCRKWSNEHKKINDIINNIELEYPNYTKFKFVEILKSLEFIETKKECYMILPRIYRPNKHDGPTIHAQLGCNSCSLVHKGRGEFIGLNEIRKYLPEDEIEIACHELGMMMALIHFIGKNDAYDIEVYLGKKKNSKKCRFYIADFDLSEEIKQYDPETIEKICWSLDAVPYFPTNNNKKLFDLFKTGYSKIAKNPDLVDEIFKNYG
jgi:hypothetical protein